MSASFPYCHFVTRLAKKSLKSSKDSYAVPIAAGIVKLRNDNFILGSD